MPSPLRSCLAIATAALLLALPVFPLQSPLSDEAVRDAYFLGQRNDASTGGRSCSASSSGTSVD